MKKDQPALLDLSKQAISPIFNHNSFKFPIDPEGFITKANAIKMTLTLDEVPIAYCEHDLQPFLERATSGDIADGAEMIGNDLVYTSKTSLTWYEASTVEQAVGGPSGAQVGQSTVTVDFLFLAGGQGAGSPISKKSTYLGSLKSHPNAYDSVLKIEKSARQ